MTLADLTLSDWQRLSEERARRECENLARSLDLRFDSLEPHVYCGRENRVARFRAERFDGEATYALVPGGAVALGFRGEDFKPSAKQIASFADSAEEYGLTPSINEFVDTQMSPPRTARVATLLIEIEAGEIGLEQLVADGPRLRGGDGGCNVCGGAGFFLGWLPLATAFSESNPSGAIDLDNVADGYCRLRRVVPVP
jgi:hypothetical protein